MRIKDYYKNPTVVLNEDTHEYINVKTNEIINGPSITKLIEYLYPFDVDSIPAEALKAGIEKGVCVHNRLSNFIKFNDLGSCEHTYNGYPIKTHTNEFLWVKEKLAKLKAKEIYSEVSISNGKVNGTFDLLFLDNNDKWHLIDFKTTSRLHKDKELLQLKFYELLLSQIFEDVIKIDVFEIYNSKHEEHYSFNENEHNIANQQMKEIMESETFKYLF